MSKFIRTTRSSDDRRAEVSVEDIRMVIDNGQGNGAEIIFKNGEGMEVNESGQSVRGYIKKALAAKEDTADSND